MTRIARSVMLAYVRLPHALPVFVVLATTAVLSIVVDRDAPLARRLALLLAMMGAQLVIGIVNELVDLELDRTARPDKPLVSGLVSVRGATGLLAASVVMMLVPAATLGGHSLLLCLLGCGLGVAYSLWFKRTIFASIPYLFALPLLPVWVAVSLDAYDANWLALYPLGWSAIIGVQVAQSLPDIAGDRAAGIVSLTTLLGQRRSLWLCWAALALSAVAIGGSGWAGEPGRIAALAVIVLIAAHIVAAWRAPAAALRWAFPLAAGSTALLGVAWVAARN